MDDRFSITSAESRNSGTVSTVVSKSTIPQGQSTVFRSSTFFQKSQPRALPTPAEVRLKAAAANATELSSWRPRPVVFPELGLLVKYGGAVTVAEGQCLWLIKTHLGGTVRVPEVYGWDKEGEETFIYMEFIEGATLEERWPTLSTPERLRLCDQLRSMMTALRTLTQDPNDRFVGSISAGPLLDIVLEGRGAGPFRDSTAFHDWFGWPIWRQSPAERASLGIEPERKNLPDDDPVSFVHADLHRSNILVSKPDTEPPRVLAIVDWHQSGWYPAYWEYCKTRLTVEPGADWEAYIPQFLEPRQKAWSAFNYFCYCNGR